MALNDGPSFPPPTGPGFSYSPVAAGNTPTQALPGGYYAVVTFQPLDFNNPGVCTLYDVNGNVVVTLTAAGYAEFLTPPNGQSYYFNTTAGAQLLAATMPVSLTRPV
jgi:hypothetical protein